jgi:MraZ protein
VSWERQSVAEFIGRAEHSLDGKGRVILPARYRRHFVDGGFLSQHEEGCLALWTREKFSEEMEKMASRASSGRRGRAVARVWAAGSHEVEIDRQGRMAIPSHLREFAALESDVLVTGAIDHVELWNPDRYEQDVVPAEAALREGIDEEEGAEHL